MKIEIDIRKLWEAETPGVAARVAHAIADIIGGEGKTPAQSEVWQALALGLRDAARNEGEASCDIPLTGLGAEDLDAIERRAAISSRKYSRPGGSLVAFAAAFCALSGAVDVEKELRRCGTIQSS